MKANNNTRSCTGTLKRQEIGGSSEVEDKNVEKVVTRDGDEVRYVGEKIRSP